MALTVTFKEGSRQKPSGSSCWDWKIIFCFGFLVLFGGNFLRGKLAGKLQGYIRPTFIFEKIADQKKNATFVLFFFVCVCVCQEVAAAIGRITFSPRRTGNSVLLGAKKLCGKTFHAAHCP